MSKITTTVDANGAKVHTEVATTLMDDVIAGALVPLGLVSDDGLTHLSKRTAAIGAVGWSVASGLFMERKGHKRAAQGSDPLVGGAILVR